MGDEAIIDKGKLKINSSFSPLNLYARCNVYRMYSDGLGPLSEHFGYAKIRSVDITHQGDRFMGVLSVEGILNKESGHTILIVPYETAVRLVGNAKVVKGNFDQKSSLYQPPGHIKAMELTVNQNNGFLWIDHISSETLVYLESMIENLSKQQKQNPSN
jgi:hypothetical protein